MKINKKNLATIIFIVLIIILSSCAANKQENAIDEENYYASKEEIVTQQPQAETQEPQTVAQKAQDDKIEVKSNNSSDIKKDNSVLEVEKSEEIKESTNELKSLTCTMTVRCDALLSNLDKLEESKYNLVPDDGIIFSSETVEFCEGESAFDVLLREMNKNNILMEFEYTPGFNSYYVEGIGNLYEFDCGDMSGWIYKVNGKIASMGCSQYVLKPGDVIEWVYTCGF